MSLWLNGKDIVSATIGDVYHDTYTTDSVYGKCKTLLEHNHEQGKCYPSLANAIEITGGAGAWALGNFVEVVPANGITSMYDIHWVHTSNASVTDEFQVNLYKGELGSEILICEVPITRDATQSGSIPAKSMSSLIAANTRISAKCASKSGGGDTIDIKLSYHTY